MNKNEWRSKMKRLAIIGSSGGNLYNQGGNDPKKMMEEIFVQAGSAGIEVAYIQFIGTNTTMDNISMDAKARLWTLDGENSVNGMQGNRCFRYNRYDEPHQGNFGSLSFFKRVEVEVQPNHRLLRQFKGPGRQRVEAD